MCIELVGWITLGHAHIEKDDYDFQRVDMAEAKKIAEEYYLLSHPDIFIEFINPISEQTKVLIAAHPKRRPRVEAIFRFAKEIGRRSPESYGLFYLHNEDSRDTSDINTFQVFVLSRGKLVIRNDPFLSPIVPVIKDKEESGYVLPYPIYDTGKE